jgi:serine/threonine-protein kinase
MGTVYLAEDARLKRRVAVKILPQSTTLSARSLRRFEREAQILANLNHPNIATLFSLENDEGLHFITMEYVPGKTLNQYIKAESPHLHRILLICRQIAAALDAAHQQGVVHRDLKPANIMVKQQDHVKVLDFGLAKVVVKVGVDGSTRTAEIHLASSPGGIVGTPGYMSPEQLKGRRLDQRSDIFAFGCCLYECLSGRMAFAGETGPERMAATLEREPDFQVLGALPSPVEALLRQSLEKDPARRLANFSTVLEVLSAVRAEARS